MLKTSSAPIIPRPPSSSPSSSSSSSSPAAVASSPAVAEALKTTRSHAVALEIDASRPSSARIFARNSTASTPKVKSNNNNNNPSSCSPASSSSSSAFSPSAAANNNKSSTAASESTVPAWAQGGISWRSVREVFDESFVPEKEKTEDLVQLEECMLAETMNTYSRLYDETGLFFLHFNCADVPHEDEDVVRRKIQEEPTVFAKTLKKQKKKQRQEQKKREGGGGGRGIGSSDSDDEAYDDDDDDSDDETKKKKSKSLDLTSSGVLGSSSSSSSPPRGLQSVRFQPWEHSKSSSSSSLPLGKRKSAATSLFSSSSSSSPSSASASGGGRTFLTSVSSLSGSKNKSGSLGGGEEDDEDLESTQQLDGTAAGTSGGEQQPRQVGSIAFCFNCRQKGHTHGTCRVRERSCYICLDPRHDAFVCVSNPVPQSEFYQPDVTCTVCGEKGHAGTRCKSRGGPWNGKPGYAHLPDTTYPRPLVIHVGGRGGKEFHNATEEAKHTILHIVETQRPDLDLDLMKLMRDVELFCAALPLLADDRITGLSRLNLRKALDTLRPAIAGVDLTTFGLENAAAVAAARSKKKRLLGGSADGEGGNVLDDESALNELRTSSVDFNVVYGNKIQKWGRSMAAAEFRILLHRIQAGVGLDPVKYELFDIDEPARKIHLEVVREHEAKEAAEAAAEEKREKLMRQRHHHHHGHGHQHRSSSPTSTISTRPSSAALSRQQSSKMEDPTSSRKFSAVSSSTSTSSKQQDKEKTTGRSSPTASEASSSSLLTPREKSLLVPGSTSSSSNVKRSTSNEKKISPSRSVRKASCSPSNKNNNNNKQKHSHHHHYHHNHHQEDEENTEEEREKDRAAGIIKEEIPTLGARLANIIFRGTSVRNVQTQDPVAAEQRARGRREAAGEATLMRWTRMLSCGHSVAQVTTEEAASSSNSSLTKSDLRRAAEDDLLRLMKEAVNSGDTEALSISGSGSVAKAQAQVHIPRAPRNSLNRDSIIKSWADAPTEQAAIKEKKLAEKLTQQQLDKLAKQKKKQNEVFMASLDGTSGKKLVSHLSITPPTTTTIVTGTGDNNNNKNNNSNKNTSAGTTTAANNNSSGGGLGDKDIGYERIHNPEEPIRNWKAHFVAMQWGRKNAERHDVDDEAQNFGLSSSSGSSATRKRKGNNNSPNSKNKKSGGGGGNGDDEEIPVFMHAKDIFRKAQVVAARERDKKSESGRREDVSAATRDYDQAVNKLGSEPLLNEVVDPDIVNKWRGRFETARIRSGVKDAAIKSARLVHRAVIATGSLGGTAICDAASKRAERWLRSHRDVETDATAAMISDNSSMWTNLCHRIAIAAVRVRGKRELAEELHGFLSRLPSGRASQDESMRMVDLFERLVYGQDNSAGNKKGAAGAGVPGSADEEASAAVGLMRRIPIFKNLKDANVINKLAQSVTWQSTYPGEYLCRLGDDADAMYFIYSGIVEVLIYIKGEETPVATLKGGAVLGEIALLKEGQKRTASLKAVKHCVLLRLAKTEFEEIDKMGKELRDCLQKIADDRLKKLDSRKAGDQETLELCFKEWLGADEQQREQEKITAKRRLLKKKVREAAGLGSKGSSSPTSSSNAFGGMSSSSSPFSASPNHNNNNNLASGAGMTMMLTPGEVGLDLATNTANGGLFSAPPSPNAASLNSLTAAAGGGGRRQSYHAGPKKPAVPTRADFGEISASAGGAAAVKAGDLVRLLSAPVTAKDIESVIHRACRASYSFLFDDENRAKALPKGTIIWEKDDQRRGQPRTQEGECIAEFLRYLVSPGCTEGILGRVVCAQTMSMPDFPYPDWLDPSLPSNFDVPKEEDEDQRRDGGYVESNYDSLWET